MALRYIEASVWPLYLALYSSGDATMTPRRALLSVFDKRGLADFARGLARLGFEIVSTGGTLRTLAAAGVPAVSVSAVTGFPEILDGRVKTLHPAIHGGILADRAKPAHAEQLAAHGIAAMDLVAVNLYPFRETVATGASFAQAIEMIDIGGPAMVRAAAKNHGGVVVVVDPADYPEVLAALEAGGGAVPREPSRRRLAAKAFRHTAEYDAAVAGWLAGQIGAETPGEAEPFPQHLALGLERILTPRYGENPHQAAAVYRRTDGPGVLGGFRQLGGKELSYNNLLDADAARRVAAAFAEPAVAIVKHNNPCGVGRGADPAAAYGRALATDPVSAFGGIVALNRPADGAFAAAVAELFAEVVIAPGVRRRGPRPARREEEPAAPRSAAPRRRRGRAPLDRRRLPRPDRRRRARTTRPPGPAPPAAPRRPTSGGRSTSPGGWRATSSRTPSCSPTPRARWGSAPAR